MSRNLKETGLLHTITRDQYWKNKQANEVYERFNVVAKTQN